MSKVFSKKRLETIQNSNVKRYLIYAVGEILIVVLGIFIAIYFNNLKETRTNRKYIAEVLNDVKAESENYIKLSTYYIYYNSLRDTLAQKILRNNIQKIDEYQLFKIKNLDVLSETNFLAQLNFSETPLENLNKRLDYLDKAEKVIYNDLSLIKRFKKGYGANAEKGKNILIEYKKFQKENLDWFSNIEDDSIAIKKEFNYRQQSYQYKNFIKDYRDVVILEQTKNINFFQSASIRVLLRTINTQQEEKVKGPQIDSILKNLNLSKLNKIKCDTIFSKPTELFSRILLHQFIYNASKDTVSMKKGKNQLKIGDFPPNSYSLEICPLGTEIHVYKKNECQAKYKTQMNSYIIYD